MKNQIKQQQNDDRHPEKPADDVWHNRLLIFKN